MLDYDYTNLTSPTRTIKAKVELFNGSTLVDTISSTDNLVSVAIDRVGEEGKFFGFGISQKATIKIRDINRVINISTENSFKIYFSDGGEFITNTPIFYATEVLRDENTNELTITAYDLLHFANKHTVAELDLEEGYSISRFVASAYSVIGADGVEYSAIANSENNLVYIEGANFDGTEGLREALTAAAEATQTIFYIDYNNELVFKQLDKDGAAALTIYKADYIELDSKQNKTLAAIGSANELGDNLVTDSSAIGETQYIRDNPFIELREDIDTILENAIAAVGGLTINQFNCSWRGNYLLECGDKIAIETKDGSTIEGYIINDSYTYSGGFKQVTAWSYTEKEETAAAPTTLGEVIKQTFAKVDKANRTIELVASETSATAEALASLQLNTESINATVSSIKEATEGAIEGLNEEVATLTTKMAELKLTDEEALLTFKEEIKQEGVEKLETSTGISLNSEGLRVSKSNSEIETQITEDGVRVEREGTEVLTANNEGVKAEDLHATTFLIIGNNSRFEDYEKDGNSYTACFWVGGSY